MNKHWQYLYLSLFSMALSAVHAETFEEFRRYEEKVRRHCISEVGAKQAVETALKNFPSKEAFLSLKRSELYYLAAPTLTAAKPFWKAPPEQQYTWLEGFLKETRQFYDSPQTMPWSIEYYEPAYIAKNGKESGDRTYKKFPKKNACISVVTIRSPNVACLNNQRLEIDFRFDSGGANNTALLRSIGLDPLPCDL